MTWTPVGLYVYIISIYIPMYCPSLVMTYFTYMYIHIILSHGIHHVSSYRWWPGQVIPMTDVPENIRKKKPGEGMFVVRYKTMQCVFD